MAVGSKGTVGSTLHGHHHAVAEGSTARLGLRAQVATARIRTSRMSERWSQASARSKK
jgi:hypothetical protein